MLCHGWLPLGTTEITAQVSIEDGGRTASGGRGRPALTRLRALAYVQAPQTTLLALRLGSGRRHQIRSHLAHLGHPSVTDGRYSSLWTFLLDEKLCARNFLHRRPATKAAKGLSHGS